MEKASCLPGKWRLHVAPLLVAFVVLVIDQLSKVWVRHALLVGESAPREGIFRFTHVQNDGIIFGLDVPHVVTLVFPIMLVIAALLLSARYAQSDGWMIHGAVGLFVGGSLGNLIDRLAFGHVTDFIDIRLWGSFHWPAFNVADASIVVGVILLAAFMVQSITKKTPGGT